MKKSSVFLGMALLAASAAHANGFYVLGAAGASRFDDFVSRGEVEDSIGLPLSSYSDEKVDVAYKVQFGYQFNDNFAIEGGYVDLGKADFKGRGTFGSLAYGANGEAEAKGFNVAGLLTLPINAGWSLFFKVGAIRAEVETKETIFASSGATTLFQDSESFDDTSVRANFGFGVSWAFVEHFGVRAEIERFNKLGDKNETGRSDVDLLSLGAFYRF